MNKKTLFSLTAILLAFSIFTVINFETSHCGHEAICHEEDCPVCLVLQIIHSTKKINQNTVQTSVEFLVFTYLNVLILSALLLVPSTLVKQKVKLVI